MDIISLAKAAPAPPTIHARRDWSTIPPMPSPSLIHPVGLGRFLFRWRNVLPYPLLLPLLLALPDSGWLEATFGKAAETIWDVFAMLVALTGVGLRAAVGGFHDRSGAGSRTTGGLYSVVRHPLYLGNTVILLGLALSVK